MRTLTPFILLLTAAGCAAVVSVQPQVKSFVAAGQYDRALTVLDERKGGYGRNNALLYALDRGMVAQSGGEYRDSIESFKDARREFEKLYTRSLSKLSLSWLWNDYAQPYVGDDFERVLINAFQALNFAAIRDYDAALVETRDADAFLGAVQAAEAEGENARRLGAFIHLLTGILYESTGRAGDLNPALVAYRQAADGYAAREEDLPEILKRNYLRVARQIDPADAREWQARTGASAPREGGGATATIYVVHYHGLSPVKREVGLTVPLPDGQFGRVAFAEYQDRPFSSAASAVRLRGTDGAASRIPTEQVEDIEDLAREASARRKAAVLAKGAARPVAKYAAVEAAADGASQRSRGAGDAVRIVGSLYNTFSERADLRSWDSLPAEIRLGRLDVPPGSYTAEAGEAVSRTVRVGPGETAILILRTSG